MSHRFRYVAASIAFAFFAVPALASAASLTSGQATAIVGLIQAFGADQSVVLEVEQILGLAPVAPVAPTAPATPANPHIPVVGSLYRASNTGYDFSFITPLYPQEHFSFGLVGVTHGKAFTQNSFLNQEYSWAQFGASTPPTFYMNLNAPYGSAVAANVSAPRACPAPTVSATSSEPTDCAGYNYGYNAAKSASAYAASAKVTAPLWWLDIEEANSWSDDLSVNDATIQGAIDYLNSQGVRVGIYSVPYMWNNIGGASFVPTQTIGGQAVSIPLWFPIGITDQIGAGNACLTKAPFIPGSPIWMVQYETSSTAIDQNYSC